MELKTYTETDSFNYKESNDDYNLLISLQAPPLALTDESITESATESTIGPVHYVFLVDISGSMQGDKINSVKDVLKRIVKNMVLNTFVSIILYDDKTYDLVTKVKIDSTTKEQLLTNINKISVKGSTNIGGALLRAKQLIEQSQNLNASMDVVILFTDGEITAGPTNFQAIANQLGPINYKIHCFGFGISHCVDFLQQVSSYGSGAYYYIKDTDSIKGAFSECLGGIASTYAQNISIKVIPLNNYKINSVKSGYSVAVDDSSYVVTIPDIQAEESRETVVKVSVPILPGQMTTDVLCVVVTYTLTGNDSQMKQLTNIAKLLRSNSTNYTFNKDVSKHVNRFATSDAIKRADELAKDGKYTEAKQVLDAAVDMVKASPSFDDPLCQHLIKDIQTCRATTTDKISYTTQGQYVCSSRMSSNLTQRSNQQNSIYTTTSRTTYLKKLDSQDGQDSKDTDVSDISYVSI
jgi:Ca-activated chloride channel family protein